jgi:hypothetical protein
LGGEVAEAFTEAGVFAGLGALAVDSVLTLLWIAVEGAAWLAGACGMVAGPTAPSFFADSAAAASRACFAIGMTGAPSMIASIAAVCFVIAR